MHLLRFLALASLLLACRPPAATPDTDASETDPSDTDAPDTDPSDTDPPADTDRADTDADDTDTDDSGPHTGDPAVDTSTPLGDAVDGPFQGPWVARGGSRLALVHVAHAGTTQVVFSHFHDTRLDLDCRFQVAGDGRLRCLPIGLDSNSGAVASGCSRAGLLIGKTCSAVRTIRQAVSGPTCDWYRTQVYALTPDPLVTSLGVSGLGSCDTMALPDGAAFADEARIATPPWRFARGLARVVPTGGEVDVVVVRANDGAVEPFGFYDPARDVPCAPVSILGDAPDVAWCTPGTDVVRRRSYDWLGYSDATCETEAAVAYDVCDDATIDAGLDPAGPPFHEFDRTALRRFHEVRTLGAVYPHGFTWRVTQLWPLEQECIETDFGVGAWIGPAMRTLLDPLGPDDQPSLRRISLGVDAPGAFAWVDRAGRALLSVSRMPFAGADGVPCAPVWDATQTSVHCVPSTGAVTTPDSMQLFADDACTERVVVARADTPVGHVTLAYPSDGDACFGGWASDVPTGRRPVVIGEQVEVGVAYTWGTLGGGGPVMCVPAILGETGVADMPDPTFFRASDDPRPITDWPVLSVQ